MFGFFKRNKKVDIPILQSDHLAISEEEMQFLRKVVSVLPANYSFLEKQLNHEFLLGKKVNPFGENGSFTFLIDQLQEKKLRKRNPYYQIKGLTAFNNKKGQFENIELDILDNILVGYYAPADFDNYDAGKINAGMIHEKRAQDKVLAELKQIAGAPNLKKLEEFLNFNNVFEIELNNDRFFTIHDFEDGNYLGINAEGKIYGLFHDPYKVELLFPDVNTLIQQLQSGAFSLDEYYNRSMG